MLCIPCVCYMSVESLRLLIGLQIEAKCRMTPEVLSLVLGWLWAFSSDLGLVFPFHSRRWFCPTEVLLESASCAVTHLCVAWWNLLFFSGIVGLEMRCQSQGYHRPIVRNIGTLKVVYKVFLKNYSYTSWCWEFSQPPASFCFLCNFCIISYSWIIFLCDT